ncbi:MAG: hypothetical protein ACRDAM_16645, partial [Casimicrobium sp.]
LFALGGTSSSSTASALYCVALPAGTLSLLGSVAPTATDAGIDADRTTGLIWEITNPSAGNAQVFSIRPSTLSVSTPVDVTLNGSGIGGFEGLAVAPSVAQAVGVPTLSEWATIALLSLLVFAAALRLKSQRQAASIRLRK